MKTKIALTILVVALVVTAARLGVFERLGDLERLKQTLLDLGGWGYVAFVGAFALLQPFGLPGAVFVWGAPLVWPWPVAFALSVTGSVAASVVGFAFARFVARDWVARRVPARFRKYEEGLARRAFLTVFLLRLVFWMHPLLHAFFGVSRVTFRVHLAASVLGYLPPLLLVSYFGEDLVAALRGAPAELWIGLGAGVVALGLAGWLLRRRRRRAARGRTAAE